MATHAHRTKIHRKDLRGPDEFVTLTTRIADWARSHMNLVLSAVGVLVVIVVVAVIVTRSAAARDAAAARDFRSAYALFSTEKFGEAAVDFRALSDQYPGTEFGRLALLYQGHALARKDDAAAAVTAYQEYLALGGQPDYLRQQALVGIGHLKEASGDAAAALQAYGDAAALEGPLRTDARLGQARLEEAAGHGDQARTIYAEVLKDTEDPDLRAFLETKVPRTAEAPPAEAAAGEEPAPTGAAPQP
jgi:hypothetical protein